MMPRSEIGDYAAAAMVAMVFVAGLVSMVVLLAEFVG